MDCFSSMKEVFNLLFVFFFNDDVVSPRGCCGRCWFEGEDAWLGFQVVNNGSAIDVVGWVNVVCSDGEDGVVCEFVLIVVVVGNGLLIFFLSYCFVCIIRHECTKAFVPVFTCSENDVFDDSLMWLCSLNFKDSNATCSFGVPLLMVWVVFWAG